MSAPVSWSETIQLIRIGICCENLKTFSNNTGIPVKELMMFEAGTKEPNDVDISKIAKYVQITEEDLRFFAEEEKIAFCNKLKRFMFNLLKKSSKLENRKKQIQKNKSNK